MSTRDDRELPSSTDFNRIPQYRRDAYRDAETSWGVETQINKAAEEFSESAAALNRELNGQQDPDELRRELADAALLLEQIEHSLFDGEAIDAAIDEAMDELVDRLELHGKTNAVEKQS